MNNDNGNLPASPTVEFDDSAAMNGIGVSITKDSGLTKREHFAAMAMQGYCNNGGYGRFEDMAIDCLKAADALLAALEGES